MLAGMSAMAAEIPAIPKNTQAETVANLAVSIFSVKDFMINNYAYKVVQMDSALNGDLSSTVIVLVGEGAVGGGAGYEAAFQMGPTQQRNALTKAEKRGGKLELTFIDLNGVKSKVRVVYNPANQTLREN